MTDVKYTTLDKVPTGALYYINNLLDQYYAGFHHDKPIHDVVEQHLFDIYHIRLIKKDIRTLIHVLTLKIDELS